MSRFDEEPDGDIHGECAHEIERVHQKIIDLRRALKTLLDAVHTYTGIIGDDAALLDAKSEAVNLLAEGDPALQDDTDYTQYDNFTGAREY